MMKLKMQLSTYLTHQQTIEITKEEHSKLICMTSRQKGNWLIKDKRFDNHYGSNDGEVYEGSILEGGN